MPADTNPAAEPSLPCHYCEDTSRSQLKVDCGHYICTDCLQDKFARSLSIQEFDKGAFPPKCCDEEITITQAYHVHPDMHERVYKEFTDRYDELKAIADDEERVFCADCTVYVPPEDRMDRKGHCDVCGTVTCCGCGLLAHCGECAGSEEQEDEKEGVGKK